MVLRELLISSAICIVAMLGYGGGAVRAEPTIGKCQVFPENNIWNTPIDSLPIDSASQGYIRTISNDKRMHADFGATPWKRALMHALKMFRGSNGMIGYPYVVVSSSMKKVPIKFEVAGESDPGPYPLSSDTPIEGGSKATSDRHVIVVDEEECLLYELFNAYPQADGSWKAYSGAVFDLKSNNLRPLRWTSADAAGLPIFPGLVRYDEVKSGEIKHALRFTVRTTRKSFVWPARHFASNRTEAQFPPMGQRFRLRADFDITGFSPDLQVILRALKKYGMILADNGGDMFLSGASDERWDNDVLRELSRVSAGDFEAVDTSSLMVDKNSAEAKRR